MYIMSTFEEKYKFVRFILIWILFLVTLVASITFLILSFKFMLLSYFYRLQNLLLQNCLAQVLEIWYVVLPGGPLPSLFKARSQGPRWPRARGS